MKKINPFIGGVGAVAFGVVTANILVGILGQRNVWLVAPVVILVSFLGVILGRFRGFIVLPGLYVAVIIFLYLMRFLSPGGYADAFTGFILWGVLFLPSIIVTFPLAGVIEALVVGMARIFQWQSITNFISYSSNIYLFGLAGVLALLMNAYFLYRIGLTIDRRMK